MVKNLFMQSVKNAHTKFAYLSSLCVSLSNHSIFIHFKAVALTLVTNHMQRVAFLININEKNWACDTLGIMLNVGVLVRTCVFDGEQFEVKILSNIQRSDWINDEYCVSYQSESFSSKWELPFLPHPTSSYEGKREQEGSSKFDKNYNFDWTLRYLTVHTYIT